MYSRTLTPIVFLNTEGYYNLKPGKQLRKCPAEEFLGYTTKVDQISVYGGVLFPMITEVANIKVELAGVKDFIVDFRFMLHNNVVVATDSGYLSAYGFKAASVSAMTNPSEMMVTHIGERVTNFQVIHRMKINLKPGEEISAIDVTPSNNYVLVATNINNTSGRLHFFNVMLKKSSFDNLDFIPMLDYTEISTFIPSYDISTALRGKLDSEFVIIAFDISKGVDGFSIFYWQEERLRYKMMELNSIRDSPVKLYSENDMVLAIDGSGTTVVVHTKKKKKDPWRQWD